MQEEDKKNHSENNEDVKTVKKSQEKECEKQRKEISLFREEDS